MILRGKLVTWSSGCNLRVGLAKPSGGCRLLVVPHTFHECRSAAMLQMNASGGALLQLVQDETITDALAVSTLMHHMANQVNPSCT